MNNTIKITTYSKQGADIVTVSAVNAFEACYKAKELVPERGFVKLQDNGWHLEIPATSPVFEPRYFKRFVHIVQFHGHL